MGPQPHLQTILPKWLRRSPARFIQERFELPDGDFVDLAWSGEPGQDEQPLVVVFHGLDWGSIHSHYAKGLFAHLQRQGNEAVLMHFRGAVASRIGCCRPITQAPSRTPRR